MDFLTLATWALAIVETGALLIALVFATKAIKSKKEKKNQVEAKAFVRNAVIALAVYLVLNFLRTSGI